MANRIVVYINLDAIECMNVYMYVLYTGNSERLQMYMISYSTSFEILVKLQLDFLEKGEIK